MRPRSLLITGFGPFPGAPENPSAWLVETLAASSPSSLLDCDLHMRVLPTEWDVVSELAPQLLDAIEPRLIVHFGLSRRARSFRIERSAHNRVMARADASGALPTMRKILALGEDRLDTQLPAKSLAMHLRQHSFAAVTSASAGSYLCNFLYYLSLDWAGRQKPPCHVLFVHMPLAAEQGGPFSDAEFMQGAQAILHFVLAFASEGHGARSFGQASALVPSQTVLRVREG
jgi:pyroglutamyl-peptidase